MIDRLDPLLERLREPRLPAVDLRNVESLVWERISARERRARSLRSQVPLQVVAVAAAFLIGVLFGARSPVPPEGMQAALVEELESLSSDAGNPLL